MDAYVYIYIYMSEEMSWIWQNVHMLEKVKQKKNIFDGFTFSGLVWFGFFV